MQPAEGIEDILKFINASQEILEEFRTRLAEKALTRDENSASHFCAYFFPYNPRTKEVFIIAHKKSGLWLAPGGHIDPEESPLETAKREMQEELGIDNGIPENARPGLLTITYIRQDTRPCKTHFDIWYFVPIDGQDLASEKEGEFDAAQWVPLLRARQLVTDPANLKALDHIEKDIFTPT